MPRISSIVPIPVLLLVLSFAFSHIHQGTLTIDSVRYASIAERILQTGDLFRLYDDYTQLPYANKPPVLFWLVAASIKFFGFSTFAAKLPGAFFAAIGLLLLWRTASYFAGLSAAFFALALFVGNRTFFRAVVDLNFEGIIVCAGLLALLSSLEIIRHRRIGIRQAVLLGFSAALLFISKPPYLFLLLPALIYAWAQVGGTKAFAVSRYKLLAALLIPAGLGLSWLLFIPSSSYLVVAASNQLLEPLTITRTFIGNILEWAKAFFLYLAPLSWIGSYLFFRALFRRREVEETFLLIWAAPFIPILFLTECRTRYLLLPLLALTLLGARWAAQATPWFSRQYQNAVMLVAAATPIVLVFGFHVELHSTSPIVIALREAPDLFETTSIICAGDNEPGDIDHPISRRASMLLRLEFRKEVEVIDPDLLLAEHRGEGNTFLLDKKCRRVLESSGMSFRDIRRFGEATLVETQG